MEDKEYTNFVIWANLNEWYNTIGDLWTKNPKKFKSTEELKKIYEGEKFDNAIKYLADKIEEKNLKVSFGLVQQGHIETIERMIQEAGYHLAEDRKRDKLGASHCLLSLFKLCS